MAQSALRSEFAISRAKINKLGMAEHTRNPRNGRKGRQAAGLLVLPRRQRANSRVSERPRLKGIKEW